MVVEKLVIMLLNADPDRPATLGAPFFQAAVGAAMDLDVEVHFAGPAIQLLRPGLAEGLYPGADRSKSVYGFMQDAHQAGACFFGCSQAMMAFGLDPADTIPEFDGAQGGAAFLSAAGSADTLTLTY